MVKTKKNQKSLPEIKPSVLLKDMNSKAREEFLHLINEDDALIRTWKDTISPIISEKIPDDLSPLQILIDGVSDVKTQKTDS